MKRQLKSLYISLLVAVVILPLQRFSGALSLRRHPRVTTLATMSKETNCDLAGMEKRRQLHAVVEQDGKGMTGVSTSTFLLLSGIVLPIWATVFLPLTIFYQLAKHGFQRLEQLFLRKQDRPQYCKLDSGYRVDEKAVIPRSQRKYDIVLLGSTGFTGYLMCRHLIRSYGKKDVKWAIAGRNQARLDQLKKRLAEDLDAPRALELDTIIVDTSIAETLPSLVKDTRAVVTTAGPFSLYGSPVVEFCCKWGTHYADITGETSWVQNMMTLWQETAQRTGAKVIHFCGNDCVPWDLTVFKAKEKIEQEGEEGEQLESISILDEVIGDISGGTVHTMQLGMSGRLPPSPTQDPFQLNAQGMHMKTPTMTNKLSWMISKCTLPWNGRSAYTSPFVMAAVNFQVLGWSQALSGSGTPLAYSESQVSPDFKSAFVNYMGLIVLFTCMLNPFTGYLLHQFILPRPGEGPPLEKMESENFSAIYAQGKGTKGTTVESMIYFPRDCGYYETARMVVECGLCMALEEDRLPTAGKHGGGFFSPAYGLGNILLHRLTKTGTYFNSFSEKPRKM
mmetsp:Transcript_10196/g.16298  ORF Transcript_10196/g.16298 Transcript_10196/m.16298 type:complete len:562 (-) Transcript_10196:157-1842(-)